MFEFLKLNNNGVANFYLSRFQNNLPQYFARFLLWIEIHDGTSNCLLMKIEQNIEARLGCYWKARDRKWSMCEAACKSMDWTCQFCIHWCLETRRKSEKADRLEARVNKNEGETSQALRNSSHRAARSYLFLRSRSFSSALHTQTKKVMTLGEWILAGICVIGATKSRYLSRHWQKQISALHHLSLVFSYTHRHSCICRSRKTFEKVLSRVLPIDTMEIKRSPFPTCIIVSRLCEKYVFLTSQEILNLVPIPRAIFSKIRSNGQYSRTFIKNIYSMKREFSSKRKK